MQVKFKDHHAKMEYQAVHGSWNQRHAFCMVNKVSLFIDESSHESEIGT